ncbi:MAG: L-serine ammonia-lyase, iron-sulfur-dependent, subunit alpha [bacterium]|nr:L-serine ammonia-lyase, iron-sulfur-dependent, subunit alpha [bacterium]
MESMRRAPAAGRIGDILRLELAPALGCTEPIAVALASARAREALGGRLRRLRVAVDRDTFKNGLEVGVPWAAPHRGNVIAAALGYTAGRPGRGLEVIGRVGARDRARARALVRDGRVEVRLTRRPDGLFVKATAETDRGTAEVVIRRFHTNIASVRVNGEPLPAARRGGGGAGGAGRDFSRLTLDGMLEMASALGPREEALIRRGIEMNMRIARRGLRERLPLSLGRRMLDCLPRTASLEAAALTAAAVEARMAGVPLPVMSSGGSGNCGIAATVPVVVAARAEGIADGRAVRRATALSHLLNVRIKESIGRRSALCGGVLAASTGAAAGIACLLGGGRAEITAAANAMLAALSCVLCDGARPACALKLGHGAGLAVEHGILAARGGIAVPEGGLLGRTLEETLAHLGRVSSEEMDAINEIVLDAMLARRGRGGR